jgi:hypothetical protein
MLLTKKDHAFESAFKCYLIISIICFALIVGILING